MNIAMIIVPIWIILMACAWALVHGAAKLRTMEDTMRTADLADVVDISPANAVDATVPDRQAA